MPEQTSIVSSGTPSLIQGLKSAKGELKLAGETPENENSLFSSNFGKALEQQLRNASTLPSPGARGNEQLQTAALAGLKAVVNAPGTGAEQINSAEPGKLGAQQIELAGSEVAGNFMLTDTEATLEGALPKVNGPVVPSAVNGPAVPPALNEKIVPPALSEQVVPPALSEQIAVVENSENTVVSVMQNAAIERNVAPNSEAATARGGTAALDTESRQARQQQKGTVTPSVPMQVLPETTLVASRRPVVTNVPGSLAEVQATATTLSRQVGISTTPPGTLEVSQLASPVASVEIDTRSSAALTLPDKESFKATSGHSGAQQLDALAVLKSPVQQSPAPIVNVDTKVSADTLSAVQAPITPSPAQVEKTSLLQPVQPTSPDAKRLATDNETVRQAELIRQPEAAARQLQLDVETANREVVRVVGAQSQGAELVEARLPLLQPVEPLQTVASRLAAHRLTINNSNSVTPSDLPLSELPNSATGTETLMAATDAKTTVQQRLATAEALLSQMSVDTSDVALTKTAPDSSLTAMPVTNVAAVTGARTDAMSAPVVQAPFTIPLDSADAESALTGNVKWMANEGVKNASMTVTPHGMGPISIKIGIEGDQMDVSIIASQHNTREALESMLPRLREQLTVQGHESVKVDVSDGKGEQSRPGNGQTFADSRSSTGTGSQENQSNSSNHQEKAEYGHTGGLDAVPDSFMAEDLQRVASRVIGENHDRPVFDAYV